MMNNLQKKLAFQNSQSTSVPLFPKQMQLTQEQFLKISSFMEKTTGIKMPSSKRTMIQSRLTSRLRSLNFSSFSEYVDYIFSSSSRATDEITIMIDLLTTNLTHFFREKQHFNFLSNSVLPYLAQKGIRSPKIWSAACSSGEEPYTLAITVKEFMQKNPNTFFDFSILATDISTKVLSKAVQGIYSIEALESLPYELKKKYFLKCKDPHNPVAKVKKQLSSEIKFDRLNLMDKRYNVEKKDVIFCRNVLIYFDRQTQLEVIKKLVDCLQPDGFLFLGHSETIIGSELPLKSLSNSTFQKTMEM